MKGHCTQLKNHLKSALVLLHARVNLLTSSVGWRNLFWVHTASNAYVQGVFEPLVYIFGGLLWS